MKSSPLILLALAISCCPSLADENDRFIEFPEPPAKTRTYDLHSVQILQPGRFTILSTSIDDPDVLRFELKALDNLRSYCKRPDGSYPPPANLFTLGPPDLPLKDVEVKSSQTQSVGRTRYFKSATWAYPYKRLAIEDHGKFLPDEAYFFCKDGTATDEWELYLKKRAPIINGTREKELFDCKRALKGHFVTLNEDSGEPIQFWPDDPAKIQLDPVTPSSYNDLWYRGVCLRVMHEKPYTSE